MSFRRTCAVLAAAAAVVPVVAGCDTSPGAAALVGGQRISTQQVQTEVSLALKDPKAAQQLGADRAGFARQVLAHLISDDVISRAAAARHVVVTPADIRAQTDSFVQQAGSVSALREQASQGGVPASELNDYIAGYALQEKLADSLVATLPVSQAQLQAAYQKNIAQFDKVHVAHILVKSRTLALHLLAEVKQDPSRFAALAEQYSIDTGSKPKGGDLGEVGRGTTVKPFDKAIFAAAPNSYVLAHSSFGYHVIHVFTRQTETIEQATPALKDTIFSAQRTTLLQQALATESRRIGVHVSPRYGTWNATAQSVQAAKDTVSSSQ